MESDIISAVRHELEASADEGVLESSKRFFKGEVRLYGVKAATVRRIAKKYFKRISDKNKEEIFALCEDLLKSDFGEEAFIAFEWTYNLRKDFEPGDFPMFERWIRDYVNNWAKCDTFCNHSVGAFIEMYPAYIEELKGWARSENRWLKRASAVSLVLPARKGIFLDDALEISDILLMDKDDMVQKGYGWLLKESSKADRDAVFEYVMRNKAMMPRTALRYAIEKMPEEMRGEAMKR
ncbi:MAG: DNA alkylation repair protein [Methanotrichaceae archaeon]|nr:DNA alkylation repair protein [Methanotrichaceae archaeon]